MIVVLLKDTSKKEVQSKTMGGTNFYSQLFESEGKVEIREDMGSNKDQALCWLYHIII